MYIHNIPPTHTSVGSMTSKNVEGKQGNLKTMKYSSESTLKSRYINTSYERRGKTGLDRLVTMYYPFYIFLKFYAKITFKGFCIYVYEEY